MLTTQHYSRNTVLNLIHIPSASKTQKLSLSLLKPIQMARSLLMLKKEIQMGTNSKGPPKASCLDIVSPGDGQIFPSGAPPHTRARLHVPPITAKHAPPPSEAHFSSINKIPTNHSETNNFCPHEYEQELCRGRTGCILAGALTAL